MVLYMGPYVPAEWIEAHGIVPHRVSCRKGADSRFLGMGVCRFAEAFAETALSMDGIRGAVMTTACDQMRRMHELLSRHANFPVFLMHVPATETNAAREYYRGELRRLGVFLTKIGGRYSGDDSLRRILSKRASPPFVSEDNGPVRLGLVGGHLVEEQEEITKAVERAGGRIVLDATETGLGNVPVALDASMLARDPFKAMANGYFSLPHPSRRPDSRFHQWLRDEVARFRVSGLIGIFPAWCDMWRAQMATIRERCGIPVLELGGDMGARYEGERVQGRIEALVETLRG